MKLREKVELSPQTTLKLGGQARFFTTLTNPQEAPIIFKLSDKLNLPVTILGGGSNIILADGVINRLFVKNKITGLKFQEESSDWAVITAGAGERWDNLVAWSVDRGFSGLELLSAIPGTVGAAPIQNIGAYGQELSSVLDSVLVWDNKINRQRRLQPKECQFGYRTSRFKKNPDRFFMLAVSLRLSKNQPPFPEYSSLKEYLERQEITDPTIEEIRSAVVAVRSQRLPDTSTKPNVGSFFTNPVVSDKKAKALKEEFPDLVYYSLEDRQVKIPAGWLLEEAGLKGKRFGNFRLYSDNALVLVHEGQGSTTELIKVEDHIRSLVEDKFSIQLEREPTLIGNES